MDTGDSRPVKLDIRRTPVHFQAEEVKHFHKMLECGAIEPSANDWAAALVLVRKKDGTVRWCIDCKAQNVAIVKDAFPLPLIEDCFDALEGAKFLSSFVRTVVRVLAVVGEVGPT